ncbi:flagellar M-ring protein FliF [Syntrophobotulus glycolicus DSM 8271]|uniref:Flagellar M-ring protein n=1 Tax=Syntrophobotulus glycolicus (strain DSM 8271 / FlGlyR) TaxID=645991 RepID=F0SZF3_SYNGF|nr:flagellar basal-body MS-ring/collar protein FliF [Syntrophobotulus glycolicus]ADY54958.1 flagellar M-ring protein FliF [Syntrophobotulus glycolicus DSM 8271]
MNFSLAEIIKSVRGFWEKLSKPQRVILIAAPLVVLTALTILIVWASTPSYAVLFSKLSSTEAGAITTKLKDLNYSYKLEESGATIQVPESQLAQIRLDLANAGLPQKSTFSFENLNEVHLGETDKDRQLRYVLGLQNELETTIQTMDGIEYARVHIVIPEQSLFTEKQTESTAAVTVKKNPGTELSADQVRAIANLLVYSVEGLQIEKVTIVDTNGNVLSDELGKDKTNRMSVTDLQLQQSVENNIQKSVQTMLDKAFGAGKTIVRTNAALNFDQQKITSQTHTDGAIESRQETSERVSDGQTTGGVPGTETNIPTYPADEQTDQGTISEKYTSTENYQPNVVQEETVVSPGQIKRLTISVMADTDSITAQQLSNIEAIVASAAGVDQNRGDVIQVAGLPFDKTTTLQEQAEAEIAERNAKILQYAEIGVAVLAILLVAVILLRNRRARRRMSGEEQVLATAEDMTLLTVEEAERMLADQLDAERQAELRIAKKKVKSPDEIEREKIRKEVEKYSNENPSEVARLVRTWLAEEQ